MNQIMEDERGTDNSQAWGRWAVVAVLLVAGVALFFLYGGRTRPVVEPSVSEVAR